MLFSSLGAMPTVQSPHFWDAACCICAVTLKEIVPVPVMGAEESATLVQPPKVPLPLHGWLFHVVLASMVPVQYRPNVVLVVGEDASVTFTSIVES